MIPSVQATRWIRCGRARQALALLDGERASAVVEGLRAAALIVLDDLEAAAAVLDAGERDYGVDNPALAASRAKFRKVSGNSAHDRRRLAQAVAAVAALPGEPHDNMFDNDADYIVCPREGAKVVVVSLGLWLPLAVEDLLFASMGYSAVHVPGLQMKFRRDPLWVLENRERIGRDMVDACRQTRASWMVFTGCSGQGLGALSFGARMQADAILVFSPTSSLDPGVLEALRDMRSQGAILTPVLAATERVVEADALKDLLENPVETTVVYDPVHPYDTPHAERLATAPNVRLEIRPGDGHLTSQSAVAEGVYPRLMHDTLKRALKRRATGKHGLHRDARKAGTAVSTNQD